MGAPGEVKWEEWMSTLTPLDSDSPLKTKSPPPQNGDEEVVSSETSGAALSSPETTAKGSLAEEIKVGEKVEAESREQGNLGAKPPK